MNTNLRVGFARVDVSPLESVPLEGYGNTHTRMSQGILDPIMGTCIVFTDDKDSVLLGIYESSTIASRPVSGENAGSIDIPRYEN